MERRELFKLTATLTLGIPTFALTREIPSKDNQTLSKQTNFKDKAFLKNQMRKFEVMINTADEKLAKELIANDASFYTPASPKPLYGGKGYLSVVHFMRSGFSDIQWKLEEMVAEDNKVAVRWTLKGTHDGEFLGVKPTGKSISACVMNFYYFDEEGKIINDIAAEGMIAILRPLGLCP